MDVPDVATHVRYEKIDPPQWFNQKSTRSVHTVFWVGRHKVSAKKWTREIIFFKNEIDSSISTVFPYRPGQRPRLYWKQLSKLKVKSVHLIHKRASSMPFNSPCLEEEEEEQKKKILVCVCVQEFGWCRAATRIFTLRQTGDQPGH